MAWLSCFSVLDFGSTARLVWIIGSSRIAEGKGPWKQGRSTHLESHCALRLRDRRACIQAHGES
jgi:hypothetical protein